VEKALLAAAAAPNEATAGESFRAATAPDWAGAPSVLEVCRAEPDGADAYALVDRLRVAAESVARSRAVDLTTPRRDVAALLGP
jgi:hypothetical protein